MSFNKLFVALSLIAFATITIAQAQSTCSPEQRKEFILTAVDKDGTVIEKLRPEHLSLKVGGAPATIADIVFQTNTPLDLAVVIDASISQAEVLPTTKAAARRFVASFPTPGQDRVALVSFSDKPNYLQVMSADFSRVATLIDQIDIDRPANFPSQGVLAGSTPPKMVAMPGSTSLWDVLRTATTELFGNQTEKHRRAMLLFTDGLDTSSSGKLNAIIDEAIKREVAVFSIGLIDWKFEEPDEFSLKSLSEKTGGIAKFPGKKKEKLEAALTEIGRRLRDNYVVGYCGGAAKDRAKL